MKNQETRIIKYHSFTTNFNSPKDTENEQNSDIKSGNGVVITSHLLWLGPFPADIGKQILFFSIFSENENLYII